MVKNTKNAPPCNSSGMTPEARLAIIIGIVGGGLASWQPSNSRTRKKRDEYLAEAVDCYQRLRRCKLCPDDLKAIEDRMNAIAKWRNRAGPLPPSTTLFSPSAARAGGLR